MFGLEKNKKIRIGFVINQKRSYFKIMASTRIRVYDIIRAFKRDKKYFFEVYNPGNKYDFLIFQKFFYGEAFNIAAREKNKGAKIILDINVNYYDKKSKEILPEQIRAVYEFTAMSDGIIAASKYLENYIKPLFPDKKIVTIEENIDEKYFKKRKKEFNEKKKFIWSGYSPKIKDLLLINSALSGLSKEYAFELIIISNAWEKIEIKGVKIKFVKYNERKIVKQLLLGDIFLAPRDVSLGYNLGHTFTKIGVAMALGLPVAASPVPSYLGSPALICKDGASWEAVLRSFLSGRSDLSAISKLGVEYCKNKYGIDKIKQDYINFLENFYED